MTRDGTFRIRDGKVAEPLVNLRFTVPMADVLGDVLGLTREPLLMNMNELYDDRFPHAALVPGARHRPLPHHRGRLRPRNLAYASRWKRMIVLTKKTSPTTTVRRVRFRSTM